jgi:predicted DNA binding CopG/RHH family protein
MSRQAIWSIWDTIWDDNIGSHRKWQKSNNFGLSSSVRRNPCEVRPTALVLHFVQMSNTITVRLPEDLAKWLDHTARKTGLPKGRIVREELEKARNSANRPFLRLAGSVIGPSDLSMRKGFSRK